MRVVWFLVGIIDCFALFVFITLWMGNTSVFLWCLDTMTSVLQWLGV